MRARFVRTAYLALGSVASFFAMPAAMAVGIQVAPVRVTLTSTHPVASMRIGNSGDTELSVQAEVMAWSQQDGNDVYQPTRDVLINPSIFRIAPGAQQIVRLGLERKPEASELSYRVFLRQLPREQVLPKVSDAPMQIQTLLSISVPIFVPPTVAVATQASWQLVTAASGKGRTLRFNNTGSGHIQLLQVVLRREDSGAELFRQSMSTYVLAGQAVDLPLILPLLPADVPLVVEATSDLAIPLPPTQLQSTNATSTTH
ncbi:fimbrial biogenesis chaperone [Comamonas sp. C24C]